MNVKTYYWEIPTADDDLLCEQVVGNLYDTHAVAIRKDITSEIYSRMYYTKNILNFHWAWKLWR